MIRCPDCGLTKSIDDFPKNRANSSGRQAYCKPCYNARMRYYKNRQHGSPRNFLLKHRYGIDEEVFEALCRAQGSVCALCCRERPLHVDHDHATGRVRGLLCFNCNQALGRFSDDPDRIRRAMDYLWAHRSSS